MHRVTHFLGQEVNYTGSRNMADIQLIQCKNQQKTSSNRRNIVPCTKSVQGIEWWCQDFNSRFCTCTVKIWLKIALNAVRLPKFEAVNGKSSLPRMMVVKDLWQRSRLAWFCACAESCVVFNIWPYTDGQIMFILIVTPKKLYSEYANQGQGFQMCGKNYLVQNRATASS